jgi:hypothetical protein
LEAVLAWETEAVMVADVPLAAVAPKDRVAEQNAAPTKEAKTDVPIQYVFARLHTATA